MLHHRKTITVKPSCPTQTADRTNAATPTRAHGGWRPAIAVALGCLWLGAALPVSAQNTLSGSPVRSTQPASVDNLSNGSSIPYKVTPPKKTATREDILARLKPETAAKLEGNAAPKATPVAEVPLYMQAPPEKVVVAELNNGEYELTRQELEAMTTARFGEVKQGLNPWVMADLERKRDEMMTQIAQEWLVVKGITVLAYKAGLTVTPEEVQNRLNEIAKDTGTANLQQVLTNEAVAVGIDTEAMQRDIKEALLVDKFILAEVDKNFPEAKLREIYNRTPAEYMTPLRVHAWQICERADKDVMSKKEIQAVHTELNDKVLASLLKAKDKDRLKAFQEAAGKVSEDTFTKDRGGDMGWLDPSARLTPEVADLLFNKLKPDKTTVCPISRKLVETPGGLSIFMVSERQEPQGLTFDAHARQAVKDNLVAHYKTEVGPNLLLAHPELNVCCKVSGYRLVGQQLEPQPVRTPPPNRVATTDSPIAPSPTPLPASKTAPRQTPRPLARSVATPHPIGQ